MEAICKLQTILIWMEREREREREEENRENGEREANGFVVEDMLCVLKTTGHFAAMASHGRW